MCRTGVTPAHVRRCSANESRVRLATVETNSPPMQTTGHHQNPLTRNSKTSALTSVDETA